MNKAEIFINLFLWEKNRKEVLVSCVDKKEKHSELITLIS